MELVELGPDDAAHVDEFLALTQATDDTDCPWEPQRTRPRQVSYMRHSWEGEPGRWFLAYDGVRPVGTLVLDASDYDNLDLAWFTLRIAPAYRRRGHGTALLEAAQALALDAGRTLWGMDGW